MKCLGRLVFISIIVIVLQITAFGQQCATNNILEQISITNPEMYQNIINQKKIPSNSRLTDDVYVIPVVVHIVYNTASQNLDDIRVFTQINILNEDFRRLNPDTVNTPGEFSDNGADVGIEFCLASIDPFGNPTTGIVRTYTDTTEWLLSFSEEVKQTAQMGDDAWPASTYLNIWVCNLQDGILGYAVSPGASPEVDGIVVDYRNFGLADVSSQPYHLGRTCTHEVGHWLGLSHIWGDDGGICAGTDNVSDTPNQSEATYGCPDFPLTDECSPDIPGVMFQNYMDYTDDVCMNIFTNGQRDKMRTVMETYRASLLTSTAGCNEIGPLPGDIAELLVYPIPSNGQFTVTVKNFIGYQENIDIKIYDVLGQLIASAAPEATYNVAQFFDLSDLTTGCYFVKVFNGTYFLSAQFMIY